MLLLLFKASFILAVLLIFYKLFLEKESFFSANRIYLIAGLAFAFALPYIAIPKMINQQGFVSEIVQQVESKPSEYFSTSKNKTASTFENTGQKVVTVISKTTSQRSLTDWLVLIYYFGVVISLLNFISQVVGVLLKVWKSHDKIEADHAIIINSKLVAEPCSFFNYIFINPASYDFETYEQILKHEKIHVSKRHSFDLLFSELAVIILWFNPLVWLWRKEVEKNIEYQTDNLLLERKAVKRDLYQMNLLKVATYTRPLTITTNYNQSLLKQRIMKMNMKKSNSQSYWKYAFMLPLLFVTLLLVNKPVTAFAQNEISKAAVKDSWQWTQIFNVWESDERLYQELGNKKDLANNSKSDLELTSSDDSKNEYESSESFDKPTYTEEAIDSNSAIPLSEENTESTNVRDFLFSSEGCRNLLKAVKKGNIDEVSEYLKDTDPDCTYRGYGESRSPLVAAARKGYFEIGQMIIDAGGDVDYHASGDESPLMAVSRSGNVKMTQLLLEHGAEVNMEVRGDGTALIYAVRMKRIKIAELLLEAGADPFQNVPGDEYAMYHARSSGNKKMIELLSQYQK